MTIPDVSNKSLRNLVSLEGRSAVVTGAARGLGRAIAQRLVEAGASVLLGDIDQDLLETTLHALKHAAAGRVLATRLDVSNSVSIAGAADLAVAELGGIDIWVNNAGIYPLSPVLQMSDSDWDKVLDINLRGTFIGAREAAKRMVAGGRKGVIINLSSTSGLNGGGPSITHYVAAKHGVIGVTKQMALELAEHRIRVLAVAPGVIVTEGVREAANGPTAAARFELDTQVSMLGRAGVPDDVARVVLFCASDLSIFMTGSTLLVDAGALTH
ncbi:MAG: SDR family NAD(P)-dependent oxidoreductase [Caulobacterales bacterium]